MSFGTSDLNVLLIEDDAGDASLIRRALLGSGAVSDSRLTWDRTLAQAKATMHGAPPDAILLDLTLPDSAGIDTVRAVRAAAPRSAILVLTGHDDMQTALQTLEAGAQDYIFKGDVDARTLSRAIRYARERHTLESQLARSRERYRMFAEAGSDWLWETDAEHRFTYFSESFQTITGFNQNQLLGRSRRDLIAPEGEGDAIAAHIACLDRHDPFKHFEYPVRDNAGNLRHFRVSGVPVFEGPQFVGYRGVASDISGFRALGQQLRQRMVELEHSRDQLADQAAELTAMAEETERQKDLAEAEARAKTDFLSTMSHEIRTPMTAVLGITDLLRKEPLSERQRTLVDTVHEAGHTLVSILNDILDVSKLQAGRLDLYPEPTDVCGVAERACQLFTARADEGGNRIRLEIDETVPAWLTMDGHRLGQILFNLIGNAVKFTRNGLITLRMAALPEHDGPNDGDRMRLEVAVIDTGEGIAPERLPMLFARFQQGDSPAARERGGSGLGLALCKALVERMGGKIGAESTPGQGSRFFFHVPVTRLDERSPAHQGGASPAESETEAAPPLDGARPRLLVAEDNRINQIVLREVLGTLAHVTVAGNGREALDAAAAETFDLIIMDIRMPVMGGLEAIRALRADPATADLPIIALSADVLPDHRAEQAEAGADASLSKPLDVPLLLDTVARLLRRGRAA
jgi:PAS domain S-box-containing protein